ncbi:unnamed protein product, partial [Amoebophrya sp. A120]
RAASAAHGRRPAAAQACRPRQCRRGNAHPAAAVSRPSAYFVAIPRRASRLPLSGGWDAPRGDLLLGRPRMPGTGGWRHVFRRHRCGDLIMLWSCRLAVW